MNDRLTFESQPFAESMELDNFEMLDLEALGLRDGGTSQNNLQRIRWIQESLNRILGLQLTVDGVMGPQTRSAIRSFQHRQGLVVDGVPGPKTEAALRAFPAATTTAPPLTQQLWIIDRFEFASSRLRSEHIRSIDEIADFIRNSQSTPNPVRAVDLLGHTDPVGLDAANYRLGCLRAWAVTKRLKEKLGWQLANRSTFRVASMGEKQPIDGDDASSRRVEVSLYYNAMPPLPRFAVRCDLPGSKPPIRQPPGGQPPGGQPPGGQPPGGQPPSCNKDELAQKVNQCISESKKCLVYAHSKLVAAGIRCRLNPVCNATVVAEYLMALKQCKDALLACDRVAKQSTNCW